MKKTFYLFMITVLLITASTSCKREVTGVELNETSLNLGIGETKTLVANVLPEKADNKAVTWTSSNPYVATVLPNGLVTGLSEGIATIVATTQDGGKSASCEVIVETVTVTGIILNKERLELVKDETATLIATVLPENATIKNVIWTSSNPYVATVTPDNGIITALRIGETVITATTFENNKTTRCTVNVVVPVSEVRLNKNQLSLAVGYTETLIATVLPSNATIKNVTWTSSNTNVATVSNNGYVRAIATGTATITATTVSGNKTANCNLEITGVVSVESVKLNKSQLTLDLLSYETSETLIATVSPSNATNKKVTWKSANSNIASVNSDGKVIAKGVGTTVITATTQDGNKTATCNVTINDGRTFIRFKKDVTGSDVYEMRIDFGTISHEFGYATGISDYKAVNYGGYYIEYRSSSGQWKYSTTSGSFHRGRKYTAGYGENGFYITDDGPA